MPFLAPLAPALIGGVAAAGAGAGISAISRGLQGNSGAGFQAGTVPIKGQNFENYSFSLPSTFPE